MRISRKRSWPDVRDGIVAELHHGLPGDDFDVSEPDAPACVSWVDGPSFSTVRGVAGTLAGWTVAFWPDFLPAPEPPPGHGTKLLRLRRSFSDPALAVAVVRFAASNPRPFDSANPAHHAPMTAILDVDDPAHCDYPLVARVAELLLAATGPPTGTADANPADRLSRALDTAGYEALWNAAWLEVDI